MKTVSVILAHPYKKSFNHAVYAETLKISGESGHKVYAHDLYGENFDPLLSESDLAHGEIAVSIQRYCDELVESDGLVFIHPNWWGQPPAILKGWIDRVLRNGLAYTFEEGDSGGGLPIGLLKGKWAVVFNTSNTPADREAAVFGDPLETIWKKCIFEFCGIDKYERRMFSVVADSTPGQREEWLREVRQVLIQFFP